MLTPVGSPTDLIAVALATRGCHHASAAGTRAIGEARRGGSRLCPGGAGRRRRDRGRDHQGPDTVPGTRGRGSRGEDPTEASCGSGRDGHVIVFLEEGATDEDRRAVEAVLAASGLVSSFEFWDHEASLAEARELFCDDSETLAKLDSDDVRLPTSYRVVLSDPSRADACAVRVAVARLPGVFRTTVPDTQRLGGAPTGSPADGATAADRVVQVVVFLADGVTDTDRRVIESFLATDARVSSYVHVGEEESMAEARRLFRCHPEMSEKIEAGAHVPGSYRVALRDPSVAVKNAVRDELPIGRASSRPSSGSQVPVSERGGAARRIRASPSDAITRQWLIACPHEADDRACRRRAARGSEGAGRGGGSHAQRPDGIDAGRRRETRHDSQDTSR